VVGRPTVTSKRLRHARDIARQPYRYKACGLPDVWLLSGYEIEQTPDGPAVTIQDLDALHRTIAHAVVQQQKALTPAELRFLRKEMDLTQAELARFVQMSSQQVARWEKGESEIPGPADLITRMLYGQSVGLDLNLRELAALLDDADEHPKARREFVAANGRWKAKRAA
jgi:putative transcriptional regulator